MSGETCDACKFFDPTADLGGAAYGLCRRHSPRPARVWPEVKAEDWCGEWEADEPAEQPKDVLEPIFPAPLAKASRKK